LCYHGPDLRILLDYRPALRERTGVGEYVHEIAAALLRQLGPADALTLFSSSWKDRLPAGRIPTKFLSDGLDRRFGDDWPERDTWIVAVRRRDGRRVVFGRSDAPKARIGEAVAASCAIPAYFTPVTIGNTQYVDGGAHSPTNADVLRGRPLDLAMVSSPMSLRPGSLRPTLDTPIRLRFHRYLNAELRRLGGNVTHTLTFEPNAEIAGLMGLNMLSARNVDEIEEQSYADARRTLHRSGLVEQLRPPRRRPRSVAVPG